MESDSSAASGSRASSKQAWNPTLQQSVEAAPLQSKHGIRLFSSQWKPRPFKAGMESVYFRSHLEEEQKTPH
jgi:hypothetical protein